MRAKITMMRTRIAPLSVLLALMLAILPQANHSVVVPLQAVEDFDILLGRPTDDSITVNVIPAETGEISFEHGTTSGVYDTQTSATPCTGVVYQLVPAPSMSGYGFGLYSEDDPYTIRVLPNAGHLRVTVSPDEATVDYVRSDTTTGGINGQVSYSYTIEAAPSETTYELTMGVDPVGSGTTNPAVGTHTCTDGAVVNVTATPSAGFAFDYWSGNCSGSGACQVTMDADKTVVAHFAEAPSGAITYIGSIGSAVSKTSGTSLVINTTAPVEAGDDIIIAYATDPNANIPPISVTDAAGNTYSEVGLALNTGQLRTYLFAAYNVNALPVGSNITLTANAAVTARAAVVSVFRGLDDEEPLDQTSTGTGSSATPSSGATATTTEADELLIGAIGTEGPDDDTIGTWDNSFTDGPRLGTTGGTADTNITVSLGYRIVSDIGAYTAAKSGITSRDWAAMVATFKAEPSGTTPRITITGTPLSAFSTLPGTPSTEQSYTVSGNNLTDDITITAPADFEISLTGGSGWTTSPLVLAQTSGSVVETDIYVRFNRSTEGTSSGNITHTSTDATTRNVAVSGTAAPLAPVAFNILLGRPTDESITANIIPDQDAEFYIEYGTSSGAYTDQTSTVTATADEPIELVIDGLSANTEVFYHFVYRQAGTTEWNEGAEHSFHTQRAPGSTFTFTIIADSHLGQYGGQTADELALYEQTIGNVGADNPDFHMDLGDTFAMDPSPLGTGMTEAEAEAAYLVERPYMGLIGDSVPIYLAIGNHENEEGWNFDDTFTPPDQSLAIVGLKYRKLYYPNPIPDDFYSGNTDSLPAEFVAAYPVPPEDDYHEDYYAWEWGDALFVVLDPFHYSMTWPNDDGAGYGGEGQDGEVSGDRWDWTLGIDQYLWLKDTLESSDATYKFVFSHHVTGGATPYGRGGISAAPYFEWGGLNADDTWGWDTERPASEGWDVPIHQLFIDNGVDVFFHGHDHIYAYEELDGIVYLECPKPDDAGYAWEPYGYGYTEGLYPNGLLIQNSGHIRVTVSPTEATIGYVRSYLPGDGTNGVVAHTITIPGGTPTTYDLTMAVDPAGGGTTDPAVGVHPYAAGADVTITATPAAGYVFDEWTGDCTGSGFCQVTMDGDKSVTAHFAPAPSILGDVNGDEVVSSTDALIVLSADADIDTSQCCPMNCGDVNGDGNVNSTDALIILSFDAGMSVSFPVGTGACPDSVTQPAGCVP